MPALTLSVAPSSAPDRIDGITGDDYNEVWMVGTRRTGFGATQKELGWVYRLK